MESRKGKEAGIAILGRLRAKILSEISRAKNLRYNRSLIALRIRGMRVGRNTAIHRQCFLGGNLRNITCGENTLINREAFLDSFDAITIGSNVGIAFRVVINTSTHEIGPSSRRAGSLFGQPVSIGDGVWIGANAYIGPGVSIGKGTIICAGAVVLRSMPENSMVAGNPARVLKELAEPGLGAATAQVEENDRR